MSVTTFLECPDCGRRTVYVSKAGGNPRVNQFKEDVVVAVNKTGICYTDHRRRSGKSISQKRKGSDVVKPKSIASGEPTMRQIGRKRSGVTNASLGLHRLNRTVMSDEEIAYQRRQLLAMIHDRRARNIPPWGMDPKDFAYGNGGLYASEVK